MFSSLDITSQIKDDEMEIYEKCINVNGRGRLGDVRVDFQNTGCENVYRCLHLAKDRVQ